MINYLLPILLLSGQLLDPKKEETKLGPIQFHVMPEIGVGLLLSEDQSIRPDDAFFMFRLPGLVLPNFNATSTGIQVQVTGSKYSLLSYSRTKIAGPAYAGGNIQIATGSINASSGEEEGTSLDGDVMAVIGLKILTLFEKVPVKFEMELFENNRPVKALVILTWE